MRRSVTGLVLVASLLVGCGGQAADARPANTPATSGELAITSPSDGAVSDTKTITVTGTAPDGSEVVRDISFAPDDKISAPGGTWSMSVDLDEGENRLTFRIGADEATAQVITVTYRETAIGSVVPVAEPTTAPAATPAPTSPPVSATPTPAPTTAPAPTPTPKPTPKPTPVPTAKPAPTPAPVVYKELSNRAWQKLVKSPDTYLGGTYLVWACITQFDAATGPDTFRAQASNKKRTYWFSDGDNALFSGDAARLADFLEDDQVVMRVTSMGSYSYDTQIGGNTTVPLFLVDRITHKGSCK